MKTLTACTYFAEFLHRRDSLESAFLGLAATSEGCERRKVLEKQIGEVTRRGGEDNETFDEPSCRHSIHPVADSRCEAMMCGQEKHIAKNVLGDRIWIARECAVAERRVARTRGA